MAELADQETLIAAPLDCEGETLVAAPLVDREELRAALFEVQGLRGPPGPAGPPGGGLVELELPDGSIVLVPSLPIIAVAQGATTPALPANVRAMAWSSVLTAVVIWTGLAWERALGGGGGTVLDPLTITNDGGEVLVNDQGEVLIAN